MTSSPTPADEIRTAAEVLRSLIEDATEGPWVSEDPNKRWGDDHDHRLVGDGKILATFSTEHNGPLNSAYAAAMHPGVAAAIAKSLERNAGKAQEIQDYLGDEFQDGALDQDIHDALALARAINGGQL